jgi:hypothetical protein
MRPLGQKFLPSTGKTESTGKAGQFFNGFLSYFFLCRNGTVFGAGYDPDILLSGMP